MAYYLTYQIKDIEGQYVMPINQSDNVQDIATRVQYEFGIIQKLSAKIYGSYLQSSNVLSQCVRCQDVVTFEVKDKDGKNSKPDFYRKTVIVPRYKSQNTFFVFTTLNFQSMTKGDKIKVSESDKDKELQEKIKKMLIQKYKYEFNTKTMNLVLFLPGGIPLLPGVAIGEFINSFPDFMPHLYAIIVSKKEIMKILDKKYGTVCSIKGDLKLLLSPDFESETDGLCEIASVLGYIQQNAQNVKRMIYSIAKFCPFAPLICGLFSLSNLSQVTGREIIQITAPLSTLFIEIGNYLNDQSNLFSSTVKFLTYFMNINISDRVPCTEFIRPFYNIGYEKYFYKNYKQNGIESIIAFDPDFRDQDWITFELPKFKEEDFEIAMNLTKTLSIVPPMSLRETHCVSLFRGKNGPWLFLAASISKEEADKDKFDYINPEVGEIQTGAYQDVAVDTIGIPYSAQTKDAFNDEIKKSIDPAKVKQLVIICVDKSSSMTINYDQGLNRFQASQKFFIKFTQACYRYHTTSLYGSIMFNNQIEIRNQLNPLPKNFEQQMIIQNEKPSGGTALFKAMKTAGDLLAKENEGNKYPNAVLRIIVISDGKDIYANAPSMAQISNELLEKKIRIDAIIVSQEIAKELVLTSRESGGVAMLAQHFNDGIDLFNKEEFFNVDLRNFGAMRQPNFTEANFRGLPDIRPQDLDGKIRVKPNQYTDIKRMVTSPLYAISEFDKKLKENPDEAEGDLNFHQNQKRIIRELQKVIGEPDDDVKVYPLKDRIDVWRVLIKGFEGSLYGNKWFYMIIEFPPEYPQHYPLFRFVKPPFHPNITDQGRVCIDTLDQTYRSNQSIKELIGQVRYLLFEPNFGSPVDTKREGMNIDDPRFKQLVTEWNNKNGENGPENFISQWKIQPDGKLFVENASRTPVPDQYLCPITRKIMKEPVLASSGVYYEKRALEKYLRSHSENATCRGKTDENGKPIPLPPSKNLNLPVDNKMKTIISTWIKENDYHDDDDEGDEQLNILEFTKRKGKSYSLSIHRYFDPDSKVDNPNPNNDDDFTTFRPSSRPRPELSPK